MNKRVTLSLCRYILSLTILILLALGLFLWWALGPTLPLYSSLPIDITSNASSPPAPNALSVVTYNIGHAQGIKANAWDYRNQEVTKKQLSMLADAMVAMNADIFLLQEVDLDSTRTFHVNQLDFIKERTKHPYSACAVVWFKHYLPFPYWPPSEHLGSMYSANCILSRFPLSNHERIIFEKPQSNPFWYNWGYIDRGIQRADVKVGDENIALLNVHLEAWDMPTREKQIKILKDYMEKLKKPIILGGDFNTVLPGASKLTGFADDPKANYENEKTLSWFMEALPGLKVPTLKAGADPHELYTFPSDHPDRRLDHIFLYGGHLSFLDYRVVKEAKTASDHLPIMARINYR
jgi:endonuclease/exonuclease/phosphatase family metal-dependent hydrolase